MCRAAFANGVHFKQLPEELNKLPDEAVEAGLVAHMCASIGCGSFKFVTAAVITLIVLVGILMTESGDRRLCFDGFTADRTFCSIGKTCFGACGSFAGNCFFCMAEGTNSNSFSAEFFTASVTINYAIITACNFTLGCNPIFNNCSKGCVGKCINRTFIGSTATVVTICDFFAYNTTLGRGCFCVSCKRVCECFNRNSLSAELFSAELTINYVVVTACYFALRDNLIFNNCGKG